MSKTKKPKSPWNECLVCHVCRLAYNFVEKTGELWLPNGHCCDMSGCIELFQRIDEDVQKITTYSGDKPDTIYKYNVGDSGRWDAVRQ